MVDAHGADLQAVRVAADVRGLRGLSRRELRRRVRASGPPEELVVTLNGSPDGSGTISPSPHGRTLMIVFPLRRSVGLRAATASSRVAMLPMFVRSRPSRT